VIRIYLDFDFVVGDQVDIPESEWKYFESVRRAQGEVCAFNRQGFEARGKVRNKKMLIESVTAVKIPLHDVSVAVALPENAIITSLVRSISELGARRLIFFAGDRSQAAKKRLEGLARLEKVAIESARQCGRGIPLEVLTAPSIQKLTFESDRKIFFLDEAGGGSRAEKSFAKSAVLIGCEGGWSAGERAYAQTSGFSFVHFNTPILRVENAVVVATFFAIDHLTT
jgi:RsmE family RNA methyltransferase